MLSESLSLTVPITLRGKSCVSNLFAKEKVELLKIHMLIVPNSALGQ